MLIIALLSAIIAHYMEIHFAIAIGATRTLFWVLMATLMTIGMRLAQPQPAEIAEQLDPEAEAEAAAAAEGSGGESCRRESRRGEWGERREQGQQGEEQVPICRSGQGRGGGPGGPGAADRTQRHDWGAVPAGDDHDGRARVYHVCLYLHDQRRRHTGSVRRALAQRQLRSFQRHQQPRDPLPALLYLAHCGHHRAGGRVTGAQAGAEHKLVGARLCAARRHRVGHMARVRAVAGRAAGADAANPGHDQPAVSRPAAGPGGGALRALHRAAGHLGAGGGDGLCLAVAARKRRARRTAAAAGRAGRGGRGRAGRLPGDYGQHQPGQGGHRLQAGAAV